MNSVPNLRETFAQEYLLRREGPQFDTRSTERLAESPSSDCASPVSPGKHMSRLTRLRASFQSKHEQIQRRVENSSHGIDKSHQLTSPKKSKKTGGSLRRSKRYSNIDDEDTLNSLAIALKDLSSSLDLSMPNRKGYQKSVDSQSSVQTEDSTTRSCDDSSGADASLSGLDNSNHDINRGHVFDNPSFYSFHPYSTYMVNLADRQTIWVQGESSPRPHLELNVRRRAGPLNCVRAVPVFRSQRTAGAGRRLDK